MDETQRTFPDWIDEIAVGPDGKIYGFEEGCWFDGKVWVPIDDYDGLEYQLIGNLGCEISPELAKTMLFRRVRAEEAVPVATQSNLAALPMAKD